MNWLSRPDLPIPGHMDGIMEEQRLRKRQILRAWVSMVCRHAYLHLATLLTLIQLAKVPKEGTDNGRMPKVQYLISC